ncbi:MAG: hypothetical protein KF716_15390 [Anaerolineae bacterium]|nr:hypothetical protein [Anaerolineae bacterium]
MGAGSVDGATLQGLGARAASVVGDGSASGGASGTATISADAGAAIDKAAG